VFSPKVLKFLVLMDEMLVKEDFVYDKHSGRLSCGYHNILYYDSHSLCITGYIIRFCNIADSFNISREQNSKEISPEFTNSMLVVLVRGLFNNLSFLYVQFPCTALSGEHMFDLVWEVVSRLELRGLKVLHFTCDNLAASCRLFHLQNPG